MEKLLSGVLAGTLMLAALPASATYKLNNYSFGSGGTAGSSSTTYSVNGLTGEQSSLQVTGNTSKGQPGNNYTQNAQVPTLTFTNPSSYYKKLPLIVNPGSNASDALFAVAISTDNFTTTNYVKSDNTIGSSLVYPTDYRNYAGWGSGTGIFVIGLSNNTTYYAKAKAIQGKYSETAYGPVASAATVAPTMSFSLSTDLTGTPPFSVQIGSLPTNTIVNSSPHKANINYTTNADVGSQIYISSLNAGLKSAHAGNYLIATFNGDLSGPAEGYGAQGSGATQSGGGPLAIDSPFNVSGNNVGSVTGAFKSIFSSPGPITAGQASILMVAKAQYVTPASDDYTDTITMLVAGKF